MNGIRFYAEPLEKEPKPSRAKLRDMAARGQRHNVFAAYVCNGAVTGDRNGPQWEGAGGVYDWHDSAICGTGASWAYLRKRCTRIDESLARKLHPRLFDYLDRPD